MSPNSAKLLPEVSALLELTRGPQSLTVLQAEAIAATKTSAGNWQEAHLQLRELQNSSELTAAQKLQLASCERHYLTLFAGYENYQACFQSAAALLSTEHLGASINLLCTTARNGACAGNFEHALEQLTQAFEWILSEQLCESHTTVFSTAVFVCNRMGQHQLALKFARINFNIARFLQIEIELQMANFIRLNCYRLTGQGREKSGYQWLLKQLEKGRLKFDTVNQFLVPVYAARAALDKSQPDCRSARRSLDRASQMGADASDYAMSQYLVALACYQLAYGEKQQAQDATLEAEFVLNEADVSLKQRIASLRHHLGLSHVQSNQQIEYKQASEVTWLRFFSRSNKSSKRVRRDLGAED
ncbi:MAG: hypothetical protein ACPGSC_00170 [Granulosicoccaceae bacterium]